MDTMSPMFFIDGYKLDHRRQYPEGTEYVYSNWTPRSSRLAGVDEVVFFGLQHFIATYLMDRMRWNFFDRDEGEVCDEYQEFIDAYLGPNDIGTDHIRALHQLGYVPLEFKALPEGTAVPLKVPMFTVENTHPDFGWLVNYFESILSAVMWLPCTSATLARRMRGLFDDWAVKTGSPAEVVDFQGHDFSMRGMEGLEGGILSGMAHLLFFSGTDSIPAILQIRDSYPVENDYFIAGSVPATEHSVMCAGGEDDERGTFDRLLNLYPKGILSVVSDTWNFWDVLTKIVPDLKDKIMDRDGKLVIRPDSGDPVRIICGDPDAEPGSPAAKGAVELLWGTFGGTETETGHRLLDSHIGVIYGDSINYERAEAICRGLAKKGFASGNVVFGMGSYGYQYNTRDTFGFAMKATNVTINGVSKSIFKKPVTDNGGKFSARGRIAVLRNDDGVLEAISNATPEQEDKSELKTVWIDGKFVNVLGFDDVRQTARA